MDVELCKRIQCGAVSQSEAGFDALLECSQAGMVGVFGCGNSNCAPYLDEMRARGICPSAYTGASAVLPIPASSAPPSLPLLTAPLPSITRMPPTPAPYELPEESWYCQVSRWANQNRVIAVLVVAGVYVALGMWRSR